MAHALGQKQNLEKTITVIVHSSYVQIPSSLDKWQVLLGHIYVTKIISMFPSILKD